MKKTKTFLIGLLLALAGSAAVATPWATEWTIGPIIRGKNYSVNMPLQPEPTRSGWAFDFPYPSRSAGHVHYVSFDPGSLAGKSKIVVNYRVTADRRTRFVPQEQPHLAGTVSLVIQRRGDSWNAKGRYEHYRWYSPAEHVHEITPGVRRMVIDLDNPGWTSVLSRRASENPRVFRDTLAQARQVGLVFGSAAARGHGVFATAPASFELLSFAIE
tara:strand:- start:4397 stop:5041 length:645 start_codon:yes stop_codon:yes gene_type:complete